MTSCMMNSCTQLVSVQISEPSQGFRGFKYINVLIIFSPFLQMYNVLYITQNQYIMLTPIYYTETKLT